MLNTGFGDVPGPLHHHVGKQIVRLAEPLTDKGHQVDDDILSATGGFDIVEVGDVTLNEISFGFHLGPIEQGQRVIGGVQPLDYEAGKVPGRAGD